MTIFCSFVAISPILYEDIMNTNFQRNDSWAIRKYLICMPVISLLLLHSMGAVENPIQTKQILPPFQQLERPTMQSMNEARQRFSQERRTVVNHGLYDDFKALVLNPRETNNNLRASPRELVKTARETGAGIVLLAENDGLEDWHGLHEDVLFLPGRMTNNGAIWFPTLGNTVIKTGIFDRYLIDFHHLKTHFLAQEKTDALIREALRNGHFYMACDWLCDPEGFIFGAVNNLGVFSMGDTAVMLGKTRLTAITPLSAKLKLLYNGKLAYETVGTNLTFEAKETGAYRLEAWLTVDGADLPWIESNPVFLKAPGLADIQLPSMAISPEVEVRKDITYLDGAVEDAAKHQLDIYLPKGKSGAPVLFFIHGGAWKSGDRSQYPPLGNRYAREGYVTVIPSYRLAPKNPHPAQIEDVAAAFTWTFRHITDHGGDTNRIFVAGHSAGGHLAALLSLNEEHLGKHGLSPKLIRSVMTFSGVYDLTSQQSQDSVFGTDPQKRRNASPIFHIKSGSPPFLVTYCQWDYFSLPGQAKMFHKALKQAGIQTSLIYIPGENHISEMLNVTKQNDPTVAAAVKFMK